MGYLLVLQGCGKPVVGFLMLSDIPTLSHRSPPSDRILPCATVRDWEVSV
jgi:hypothetical protein